MTDDSRLRILASEHLPDGVASEIEFLEFFRHLLRAMGNDLEAQGAQVRVVCWLVPGSVHHYIVVRESRTGRLRCRLEIAIAARVSPGELDRHATHLARIMGEALNLACIPLPPDDPGSSR
jgi:hypothetical protein